MSAEVVCCVDFCFVLLVIAFESVMFLSPLLVAVSCSDCFGLDGGAVLSLRKSAELQWFPSRKNHLHLTTYGERGGKRK